MNATALDTRRAWTAPSRAGYDASASETESRVRPMLADERVVWLSSVRPDGTPHLVPTWFWWDGRALVVFSKPEAVKVRNLRANPRLMVAVGDPEDDFSVGLIEAEARIDEAPADVPDAFFVKYADEMGPGRLDPTTFRSLYTQSIRIVPTRFLAWHGRGAGPSSTSVAPSAAATPVAQVAVLVAAGLDRIAARLRGVATTPVGASA
jgi:PPOX class probable F420-dependent enzyme